jgi:glycosyltransferase XagB
MLALADRSNRFSRQSALELLSVGQRWAFMLALALLGAATVLEPVVLVALVTAFWVAKMSTEAWFAIRALGYEYPSRAIVTVEDPELPDYTILLPMYGEAQMIAQLVREVGELEYPVEHLQVLCLLEADDLDTWAALWAIEDLPPHIEAVSIADRGPRGKPRALNVGLARATGELCAVYDAEDRPDPDQLLRVVGTFRCASPTVACVQARLAFYNFNSSWVSRFFSAEYKIHFGQLLTGMACAGMIPPLGGTSNHFRTDVLREIASQEEQEPWAWDSFNVTEDADLAIALAYHGYDIALVDSSTLEEATADVKVAVKQRSRWLKGYIQTGLVWTRHPLVSARRIGPVRYGLYMLQMLGTPLSYALNPWFWVMTCVWFLLHPHFIAALYLSPIYYAGLLLLFAGNALKVYQLMQAVIGSEEYSSAEWMLLAPLWWAITTCSAYLAIWELLRPATRHTWRKTEHGHTLAPRLSTARTAPPHSSSY